MSGHSRNAQSYSVKDSNKEINSELGFFCGLYAELLRRDSDLFSEVLYEFLVIIFASYCLASLLMNFHGLCHLVFYACFC